jgi:vancomycin resistance protein YoaR
MNDRPEGADEPDQPAPASEPTDVVPSDADPDEVPAEDVENVEDVEAELAPTLQSEPADKPDQPAPASEPTDGVPSDADPDEVAADSVEDVEDVEDVEAELAPTLQSEPSEEPNQPAPASEPTDVVPPDADPDEVPADPAEDAEAELAPTLQSEPADEPDQPAPASEPTDVVPPDVDPDEVPADPVEDVEDELAPTPQSTSTDEPEPLAAGPVLVAVAAPAQRHWKRRIGLAVVLVLAACYFVGFAMTGLRMAANASIGGVDVGGKSPAQARQILRAEMAPRADNDVVLQYKEQKFVFHPRDLDLQLDAARSVLAAGGRHSFDPRDMLALLFGRHETAPVIVADGDKLEAAVKSIAAAVDIEVIEAQITFGHGVPKPRDPVPGLRVRKAAAGRAVKAAYLVATKPTTVPTSAVEPAVGKAGLAKAMEKLAKPAVSAPVPLLVGKKRIDLPVSAYAPALVVRVEGHALALYLDPKALAKPLTNSTTGIGPKALDARIDIVDGAVKLYPSKPGVGLQPEEMAEKLIGVLTKSGEERSVAVEAKAVDPEFTTEDAKALNIREKVGEFTTYFPYAEYRNINQGRAAELIDGTLLKPGDIYSMNDIVGERTAANGFVKGFVIKGGVFREEQGGGVSQVATTTYNAAFFAGLEDVEHHPHQLYISRYPVGREATVYYGSLDLRFRDDTKNGILVKAWVVPSTPGSQGQMHVELWGTKVWDIQAGLSAKRNFRNPGTRYDTSDECVAQEIPAPGFDVDVYRYFIRNGVTVKTETDTANYSAEDKVVCGPKPKPSPSPSPKSP